MENDPNKVLIMEGPLQTRNTPQYLYTRPGDLQSLILLILGLLVTIGRTTCNIRLENLKKEKKKIILL